MASLPGALSRKSTCLKALTIIQVRSGLLEVKDRDFLLGNHTRMGLHHRRVDIAALLRGQSTACIPSGVPSSPLYSYANGSNCKRVPKPSVKGWILRLSLSSEATVQALVPGLAALSVLSCS